MITAAQLRAARGLLDWTRSNLAKAANISPETIKNIEHGTFRPQENTSEAIARAFGAHNVEFTADNGVRHVSESVMRLEGVEGFKKLLNDVYEAAQQPYSNKAGAKPIYIAHVDDRYFATHLGDFFSMHVKRMNALADIKMKILVHEEPHTLNSEEQRGQSYREYRLSSNHTKGNVPFYVFGNNLAIIIFDEKKPVHIVVISSEMVADAYRGQFEEMWNNADIIKTLVRS